MKSLFDPKVAMARKVRIALAVGVNYLFRYPKLWIPCFCAGRAATAKPLRKHMKFIRQASRCLAKEIFHKMVWYQKKLVSKQNILNRFVDIGVDLFAMSATLSYADTLFKGGKKSKNSLELADLFCRQARERIKLKFKEVCHNQDKLSKATAKKLLVGEYDWLENDIIK